MRIVTDGYARYAIRWGIWPFYMYFDLRYPGFWWSKSSHYYVDCWGNFDTVTKWYGKLNPKKCF